MKQHVKGIVVLVMLLCISLLEFSVNKMTSGLYTQTLADRWSSQQGFAQISCFFSNQAGFTENQIVPIQFKMKEKLTDAAVDSEEISGRTFMDAYSTCGQVIIDSDRASTNVRVYAVGGDFFQFHPMKLKSGNYFDGEDLNDDGVILDEQVAWILFGSRNVTGMPVQIGDVMYTVRGVIESEKGAYTKAATEQEPTIYVAYSIMDAQTETALPIDCYEMLVVNPVKQFGYSAVTELVGNAVDEEQVEIVENSARFDVVHRFELLRSFGKRSMHTKAIVYPYWENRVRAYEDIVTILFVIELICAIILFGVIVRSVWLAIKHRDVAINWMKGFASRQFKKIKMK